MKAITVQVPTRVQREETTISTRFRRALGVCVLTTALAVGGAGGTIASADDAGGTSASTASGTSGSDTATAGTSSPEKSAQDAVRDLAVSVTTALNPAPGKPAQVAEDPAEAPAEDPADEDAADTSATTTSVDTGDASVAAIGGPDAQPDADPVTPRDSAPEQSATKAPRAPSNSSTPAASHSDPVAPSNPATPAKAPAVAVTPNPTLATLLQPAAVVVSSATNVVITVGGAIVEAPGLIVSLPSSPTPVTDVIAFLQRTLTSVDDSLVPLASLPADVAAAVLALSATPSTTATARLTSEDHAPGNIALDAPRTPAGPTTSGAPVDSPLRNPVTFATVGGFAAPVALTAATRPAAAPGAAPAEGPHSMTPYITGALAALLISASLWALFAAALPGLGGLAAIGATGVRIGYRQAKAGNALYRTDLARFAPRGPIGVVRSDSLVSVHLRSASRSRTDGSPATRHLRLVDTAA